MSFHLILLTCLQMDYAFSYPDFSHISLPRFESKKMTGMASWYGKELLGTKMANGRRFNMYAFTAAHRTLPLGTVLRVYNPRNKAAVHVTITDRGPYVRGRILDLSYAAAHKLDLIKRGVEHVELTIVRHAKKRKKKS